MQAADAEKARLAERASEMTDGAVHAATQRDALLAHLLKAYNVSLPDMQAGTIERRLEDPELPEPVKELLSIRLQASGTSVSKYKAFARHIQRRSTARHVVVRRRQPHQSLGRPACAVAEPEPRSEVPQESVRLRR